MAERAEEGTSVRLRLFVGGLAPSVTANDLRQTLERLGTIHNVEMLPCKQVLQQEEVGSHRGFAYVDYEGAPASLAKLMSVYNGCKWRGGKLRIEKAKEHYLAKLRREWEADAKSEEGTVTAKDNAADIVSEAVPVSNSISVRRDLKIAAPSPGLRILFPNTTKVKLLPMKGTGKHKYSFRREESLPLHLIYSSMDDDKVFSSTNGMAGTTQSKRSGAEAGSKHLSASRQRQAMFQDEISRQQPRKRQDGTWTPHSTNQSLSGQELEDSLREERKRQLELLAKLFPGEEDSGIEARNEDMSEQPTFDNEADEVDRGVEDVDAMQVNSVEMFEEPVALDSRVSKAPSTPSPWDKLFEAAAGVGIAEDISDSETSDLIATDGTEDETPTTENEPQEPPVKDPATIKKKVNWKDLQEDVSRGGKKRGREEDPHFPQKLDDNQLGKVDHEDAASELAAGNQKGHVMRDINKRNDDTIVDRNPFRLDPVDQEKTVTDGLTSNLQGRGSVKKRSKGVSHAIQTPEFPHVPQVATDQAGLEEAVCQRGCSISGQTREEKWKKIFEAAEGVQVSGLDQAPGSKHEETVEGGEVSDQNLVESSREPANHGVGGRSLGIQGENQEQKWKRIFEAAGGVEVSEISLSSASSVRGGARITSRRTKGNSPTSEAEDKDWDNDQSNGSEAEISNIESPHSTEPEMHLVLPQIGSLNLETLAGKSLHSAGPDVNAERLSDIVDSVNERDMANTVNSKAHDTTTVSGSALTPAAPKVDGTVKWMQKASWKSLVGEKGVVGFSISNTFVPDLLQRQVAAVMVESPLDMQQQLQVTADKAEQQLVTSPPVQTASMVDERGPSLNKTDVKVGRAGGATEVTGVLNPAPDSGETCTFMRSGTAYEDWLASKSKLKLDCKAKHKAAKRQIRRMRPARKI